MYRSHWGLRVKPFNNTLDPAFLYYAKEHEEALVRLLYTVSESKGIMLLTGEGGLGKTFLCHTFRRELATKGYKVGMVVNPADGPLEILRQVAFEFGLPATGTSKAMILSQFQEFAQENLDEGNDTILIIDEAQAIQGEETWEEIRLLHNFQDEARSLVTIILCGHTRLKKTVKRLPDLAQRIGVSYTMRGLTEEETARYIEHRLRVAGVEAEIFSEAALREIYAFSGGVPLKINNVCDLALLLGCSQGAEIVGPEAVREAMEDLVEFAGYAREQP